MALDGTFLSLLRLEIARAIGSRIQKINMPTREELVLVLSAKGFSGNLFMAAGGALPRIQLTKELPPNPPSPPMLCMLLRKVLGGARLVDVRQTELERVLFLDFEGLDELGDVTRLTLCCEMLGRRSNLILLDANGKIIDSVRRSSPEAAGRLILPGVTYEMPSSQAKCNWLRLGSTDVLKRLSAESGKISEALCRAMDGVSPLVAREVVFAATQSVDTTFSELAEDGRTRLKVQLDRLIDCVHAGGIPTLISDLQGVPFEFTYLPITQYGRSAITATYSEYSELMDAFYLKKDHAERLKRHAAGLLKALTTLRERTARKINHQKADLKKTEDREELRIRGELIKANLGTISPGAAYCDAVNYYDPECAVTRIPLQPALSPAANAQRYFKEYRKASAAAGVLGNLIGKGEEELEYFDSVFDMLSRAETIEELDAIAEELRSGGYLRTPQSQKKGGKKRKPSSLPPLEFYSDDGFQILVGRNNRQNDELTLGIAEKNDLWLHTKGIPGSHVIIRCQGKEPSPGTITQAATLAAYYSKGRLSALVPVDYTKARYVKKPSGSKPGMVIYTTNETAYVTPNEALVRRLTK